VGDEVCLLLPSVSEGRKMKIYLHRPEFAFIYLSEAKGEDERMFIDPTFAPPLSKGAGLGI